VHVVPVGVGRGPRGFRQGRVLGQQRGGVDPDAVDAAIEPEPQDVLELLADLRVGPVEVRLLGREQVQVPLPGRAVDDAITRTVATAIWFGLTTGYLTLAGRLSHPRKLLELPGGQGALVGVHQF